MDDVVLASRIASKGMKAQSTRLRVIAENIANANSTGNSPGADPYQRKLVTFRNQLDRELGADIVKVRKIEHDDSEFSMRYDPTHPAANAEGYVKTPNINPLIEMMDMKEAQRSYAANMEVITVSRGMVQKLLGLLSGS